MPDYPQRLHHKTPSWVPGNALFHIRIRVAARNVTPLTDPAMSRTLLAAAERYHLLKRWDCQLFLLMPDHLHALLQFPSESALAAVVRDWKRGTARFQHIQWQENFFDHRLRNAKEAMEKWHYIRLNPVAKGLCAHEDDWPHSWGGTR